jgi:hypothetical protein
VPRAYRAALLALALLVTASGAFGALSALVLDGWPLVRGVTRGLTAFILGAWFSVTVLTERWPRWLARLLGDDDAA